MEKFIITSSSKKLQAKLSQKEKEIAFKYFEDLIQEEEANAEQNNGEFDTYAVINSLRSLESEKTISKAQYDYIMENWDVLLNRI